jgi:hypothetical protein
MALPTCKFFLVAPCFPTSSLLSARRSCLALKVSVALPPKKNTAGWDVFAVRSEREQRRDRANGYQCKNEKQHFDASHDNLPCVGLLGRRTVRQCRRARSGSFLRSFMRDGFSVASTRSIACQSTSPAPYRRSRLAVAATLDFAFFGFFASRSLCF